MKNKLLRYIVIGLFCYTSVIIAAVDETTTPILSPQLDLSIPILNYEAQDGNMLLWAELKFYSVTKDGELLFKLSDYGLLEQPVLTEPSDTKDEPATKPSDNGSTKPSDSGSTKPSDTTTNPDTSSNSVEPEEFAGIVKAHNVWRKKVGVPNLKWSAPAAKLAQSWANSLKKNNNCDMKHNPKRGDFGENIYWSKGFNPTTTEVVDAWGKEVDDYNYKTNTCKAGKQCGHYTQVVWKTTKEVGCGKASCDGREEMWVCNYSPPGNVVGKKPY